MIFMYVIFSKSGRKYMVILRSYKPYPFI